MHSHVTLNVCLFNPCIDTIVTAVSLNLNSKEGVGSLNIPVLSNYQMVCSGKSQYIVQSKNWRAFMQIVKQSSSKVLWLSLIS